MLGRRLHIVCIVVYRDVEVLHLRVLYLDLVAPTQLPLIVVGRILAPRTELVGRRHLLEVSQEVLVKHILGHFLD